MILKDRILEVIQKDSLAYSKPDNLFLFIANTLGVKFEVVKIEVEKLIVNGDVFEFKKGKFVAVPSYGYVKGRYIGNAKGFGFVEVRGQEEDVFIPANKSRGAIDGDFVIVKLYNQQDVGGEGEVVSIYKKIDKVVGCVQKISKNLFLEPDNVRIAEKIVLKKSGFNIKENDKIVVKIIRGERGKISGLPVELLGQNDDVKTLELAIIRQYNLYEEFGDDVIEASEKIPQTVTEKQKEGRLDLRDIVTFTIDGEDAKDFDDAVSIKRVGDGYELGVHIADVGEYVKAGSVIDDEAYNRGTSVYFPTSVLPMLPVSLSNGICSLKEGVERLTLSCIMQVDANGKVTDHKICESVIKSCARLTYTQVFAVLDKNENNKAAKFKDELVTMNELAKILAENKNNNGALNLELKEPQFVFDENGYVVDVESRERNDAHKLIEEFMILANETVAKEFNLKGIPFVYRVHEAPKKEKLKNVLEFMKGLGLNVPHLPNKVNPEYYQKLLALVEGKDYEETVNKVVLRSLQKAKYSKESLGHFGLALVYYSHFTSPIRRYPDLTIHRIIKELLKKKTLTKTRKEEIEDFVVDSSIQSSETEINADKAERDVDNLWKVYLMKDRVGEIFDAVITGVSNFGFFVGLENSAEGLVKIESLPQDNYLYFENSMMLKGGKFSYKLGDVVKVKLVAANLYIRKLTFEVV